MRINWFLEKKKIEKQFTIPFCQSNVHYEMKVIKKLKVLPKKNTFLLTFGKQET